MLHVFVSMFLATMFLELLAIFFELRPMSMSYDSSLYYVVIFPKLLFACSLHCLSLFLELLVAICLELLVRIAKKLTLVAKH